MLLVGPPSPLKRRLAMAFAELTQRPVQVVTITSDLTEADLKQRRGLKRISDTPMNDAVDTNNNHISSSRPSLLLVYENAAPVDAALHGDLLILDGIERASRNVLPTLNNLIEHRSMNLEDGRLLVPSYQARENEDN